MSVAPTSEVANYTPDFEVLYPTIKADVTTARIKILRFGDPYSTPGTCVVCGCTLSPDKEFVDFGLDIEFYGAIYVDTICIREALELLRYVPVDGDYHTKLFNGYKAAVDEVGKLRKQLAEVKAQVFKDVIDNMRNYIAELNPVSLADSFVMASIPKDHSEINGHADGGTAESVSADNETGSISRSDEERGHSDLFDIKQLEDDLRFDDFKF